MKMMTSNSTIRAKCRRRRRRRCRRCWFLSLVNKHSIEMFMTVLPRRIAAKKKNVKTKVNFLTSNRLFGGMFRGLLGIVLVFFSQVGVGTMKMVLEKDGGGEGFA